MACSCVLKKITFNSLKMNNMSELIKHVREAVKKNSVLLVSFHVFHSVC